MIRLLSFIVIFISALFSPFWFFVLAGLLYAFIFSPYELLLIGVLIDAQFGSTLSQSQYFYTLATATILAIHFFLVPQLRLNNQRDAIL